MSEFDRPVVSVVIPAYNVAPYIAETIESALNQTYSHHEIIVVNDGSTDDTERRVEPYFGHITYVRQENGGHGRALNTGFRAAKGEYIAMLDGDDIWLPEYLESQLHVAARHPDSRLIGCDGNGFEDGRIVAERLLGGQLADRLDREPTGELTGYFYFDLLAGNAITCPAQTLIPRAVVQSVGAAVEDRKVSCDWDYYLRIAQNGPITLHRRALVRYRYRQTSISGPRSTREFTYALRAIHVLKRHLAWCAPGNRPLVRQSLRQRVRDQAREAYYYARKQGAAYGRVYLLKLFWAAPSDPRPLLWFLATWVPATVISVMRRAVGGAR